MRKPKDLFKTTLAYRMYRLLKRVEWSAGWSYPACPICGGYNPRSIDNELASECGTRGHTSRCSLASVIREFEAIKKAAK